MTIYTNNINLQQIINKTLSLFTQTQFQQRQLKQETYIQIKMKKGLIKQNQKLDKSLQQLYYIFTYYCSFADRQNIQFLKIQNFRRMLTDAQLLESPNTSSSNISSQPNDQAKQIDILYSQTKKNNSGITFQNFLAILPDISKILFKENYESGVKKMVSQNFHALYEFIYQNTQIGQCIKYFKKTSFSQNCFILLRALSATLYQIYAHYFDVNSLQVITKRSDIFKKITLFMKSFEITPHILTKTESFLVFNYVMNEQKLVQCAYKQWFQQQTNKEKSNKKIPNIKGKNININQSNASFKSHSSFSFFNFISYILLLSLIANKKIVGTDITSNFRRLINFLQVIQVSNGFAKLCKKQKINLHLVNVSDKLVKQLQRLQDQGDITYSGLGSKPFETQPGDKHDRNNLVISRYSNSPQNLYKNQQFNIVLNSDSINQKLIQNYSNLHKKFIQFCLHGQTIGSSALSHKKIIDLIKVMQLGIKQSEIQVYIASINNINSTCTDDDINVGTKMNKSRRIASKVKSKSVQFQEFIQLLQKISQKQNIQIQKIIQKILRISVNEPKQKLQKYENNQNNYGFSLNNDKNQINDKTRPKVKLSRNQYRNCIAMVQMLQDFLYAAFILQIEPSSIGNLKSIGSVTTLKGTKAINYPIHSFKNMNTSMTFISLNSYLKILHEFELIPMYLSKQSIIQIFRKSIKKSYDFMSFSEFKDSFIISIPYFDVGLQSFKQIKQRDKDSKECICGRIKPETKLIIVFERINQSRGAVKISKNYPSSFNVNRQDNLSKFRQIFSQFYPQNIEKNNMACQCYCNQQQIQPHKEHQFQNMDKIEDQYKMDNRLHSYTFGMSKHANQSKISNINSPNIDKITKKEEKSDRKQESKDKNNVGAYMESYKKNNRISHKYGDSNHSSSNAKNSNSNRNSNVNSVHNKSMNTSMVYNNHVDNSAYSYSERNKVTKIHLMK